jgi:hypothetical protein
MEIAPSGAKMDPWMLQVVVAVIAIGAALYVYGYFRITKMASRLGITESAKIAAYRESVVNWPTQQVAGRPGMSDVHVGVPNKAFLASFDGFEMVAERDVQQVIDTLLIGDANKFQSRFRFRHDDRGR